MTSTFKIGRTYAFNYHGHNDRKRQVKVEKVTATYIVGWDCTADGGVGGYRTFSVEKGIENVEVVA